MEINIVHDKDNGKYIILEEGDVYDVNPYDHYEEFFLKKSVMMHTELMSMHGIPILPVFRKVSLNKAEEEWNEKRVEIESIKIPTPIVTLFKCKHKKTQQKLLRGFELIPELLAAIMFYAFNEHGYLLTRFSSEYYSANVNKADLPVIIDANDNKVKAVGKTTMTEGQMKDAVTNRNGIVATILKNDEDWHCFFITQHSAKGMENWKGGQPHFHYISSYFGLELDYVIEQLKSEHYKIGNLPHIDLNEAGQNE